MREYDLIRSMAEKFPRSPRQRNELFVCDAELIEICGHLWAVTVDEFSPEEDLFTSENPERLGANLATATLSDLLAAGAAPQFFLPAVALPKSPDPAFVEGLCAGVRSVLDEAGCFLCGGDVGTADTWRFCGVAMGPIQNHRALTHVLPDAAQTLWVTGRLGDANLAALRRQPTPRFELRLEEAKLIRRYGTACIDTSGGLLDAVWIFHSLNPRMRFEVECETLPLAPGLPDFAAQAGFPPEAALLGGAGEYELLFATPEGLAESAVARLTSAGATQIGSARMHEEAGVFFRRNGRTLGTMTEPPPCPRDAATVEEHVQEVMQVAKQVFGVGRPDSSQA